MPKLKTVRNADINSPAYFVYNDNDQKFDVFKNMDSQVDELQAIYASNRYSNIETNITSRDGFSRSDYDWFRPEESTPTDIKNTIGACMKAHYKFALVRNVVELMADFASKGIRLAHKNKKEEAAYQYWFNMVGGKERSERFLNYLYRCGNIVVTRTTAKIKDKTSFYGEKTIPEPTKVYKNTIPYKYAFHNPMTIEVAGGNLAVFAKDYTYVIKIPADIKQKIKSPKTDLDKKLIASIDPNIVSMIRKGADTIELSPENTRVFHYKKDDWQIWAYPLTSSILSDLITLDKMKLADLTALDSATSKTRVWKLGDLDKGIIPGPGIINAFKNILMNRVPGDALDLVWNPAIDLIETKADLSSFLGETKYAPILSAIYSGLGIPSTLVAGGGDKGFTNNFISMKTLIERLQYGRDRLVEFWQEEIRIFQKAMGYDEPAVILFDTMNLSDESAEKALWVQLFDRNVISIESIQERFGVLPQIEKYRINRERKEMSKGSVPNKVGPYVEDQDVAFTKILLQNGEITPSEAGVELEPKKEGEVSRFDKTLEMQKQAKAEARKQKGVAGQGRPVNKKDSSKRKQRQAKPRSSFKGSKEFVEDMFWAKENFPKIRENLKDVYLLMNKIDNVNPEQQKEIDRVSFSVLCHIDKNEMVTPEVIKTTIMNGLDDEVIADDIFLAYMANQTETESFNEYAGFMYSNFNQIINSEED